MKAIILAGGGGSRLFPLSRTDFPKQFLKIAGQESLLVQTIKRFLPVVEPKDLVIVTNNDYYYFVKTELESCNAEEASIVCEPVGRNTAPAIALSMKYCEEKLGAQAGEVLFVTPSDHLVNPTDEFAQIVRVAEEVAESGSIVTLGVKPDKPETGYGYIQAGTKNGKAYIVDSFKEKPDVDTAKAYLQAGNYYWNAGMFAFTIDSMQKELTKHQPDIMEQYAKPYEEMLKDFPLMTNTSIDYAVAEKSDIVSVLPLTVNWNDIGSWDAIAEVLDKDSCQNIVDGDAYAIDCKNTMILGNGKLVAGIGLEDLNIIDTPDAILITKKGDSQKVKHLVDQLKSECRKEVTENLTTFRPWGSCTILSAGDGYKVKKIVVKPGHKLSLQLHYHRSEHWTVISGTGKLTLDDKVVFFKENESTYIPIATKHRLENPGQIPLEIIEVQNGKYLGEDDIVRFDDIYGRPAED